MAANHPCLMESEPRRLRWRTATRSACVALCVAAVWLVAGAIPALADGVSFGNPSGGYPQTSGTDCGSQYSGNPCTYVAEGSEAAQVPLDGTLSSFTLGHGPVSVHTLVQLDVFSDSGGTLTLEKASSAYDLAAGNAGLTSFDVSSDSLSVTAGEVLGVTLTPDSGVAPSAVIAASDGSTGSWTCDGAPTVGQPLGCGSNIENLAHTVALSAVVLAPPTVTPQAVSGLGTTAATVNALVNPNGLDTNVAVFYGTDQNNLSQESAITDIGTGVADASYSQQLTGLAPNTTYYYYVAAANSQGNSYTADSSFTTPATPPPPPATSSSSSSSSSSSPPPATITPYVAPTITPVTAQIITPYQAAQIAFDQSTIIQPLPASVSTDSVASGNGFFPLPADCNEACADYAWAFTDALAGALWSASAKPHRVTIGRASVHSHGGRFTLKLKFGKTWRKKLLASRHPVRITIVEKVTDSRYGFTKTYQHTVVLKPRRHSLVHSTRR